MMRYQDLYTIPNESWCALHNPTGKIDCSEAGSSLLNIRTTFGTSNWDRLLDDFEIGVLK